MKILVVDDEKNQREILGYILKKDGYNVLDAASAEDALKIINENEIDVVVTDLKLPNMSGIDLLDKALKVSPDTSIIIITGHGTIDSAVSAIKRGAFDYITKPLKKENILNVIKKAAERSSLIKDNKFLVNKLSAKNEFTGIIGEHPIFKNTLKMIFKIAPFDSTVLILGESGTGKDLIARAIHNISPRKSGPFIPVNCAALPEQLIESELFGYTQGAFTGASTKKKGLFEAAINGTIFLDEISEMPMSTQAKLLRVLQNKEIMPVGSTNTVKIDTRIIAATNRNLEDRINEGTFRADLYYRLNVFLLQLPSLRERSSDIPLLVNFFLNKYSHLSGGKAKYFTSDALKILLDYQWPGNIRELETVIQKAIIYSDNYDIKAEDLDIKIKSDKQTATTANKKDSSQINGVETTNKPLDEIERDLIIKAMEDSDWKIIKASKVLGISYRTLQYRLIKYGIQKEKK